MAEEIERRLERFVPTFEQLVSLGIFNKNEVQKIINQRRQFEYGLESNQRSLDSYLKYIEYETAVMELTDERKMKKGIESHERLLSDADWPRHIHSIFRRATHHFAGDITIWNLYIDFCHRTHSVKALSRVFAECVRLHGHKPEFWIRAIRWEMGENGNLETAKTYVEEAIKRIPGMAELYVLCAEVLLAFAKQIEQRRELQQIEEKSDAVKAPLLVFRRALEQCENKMEVFEGFLDLFRKYDLDCGVILETGLQSGDPKILASICRHDSNPVERFKELLKGGESALKGEFVDYLCETKNGKELSVAIDDVEDFSREEQEKYAKVFLECGQLEEAESFLEEDLDSLELQRLKLQLIDRQTPTFSDFVARSAPLIRTFDNPVMNSDLLFYAQKKTNDAKEWIGLVKQKIIGISPEVAANVLKVTYLRYGPEEAQSLLDYMLPMVVPMSKFIQVAIEVLRAQKVVDQSVIRSMHEMNVSKWGKTNKDAWLDYIQFEREQGNLKRAMSVRWKAEHTLEDPSVFLREYQERFC